jgi:hypothetical protein
VKSLLQIVLQGLLMKAESYYQMMQFEYALMFYHRGNKLRPEVQAFRLGIQKSQEAIENCIGGLPPYFASRQKHHVAKFA